jgi:hypothetical protein
VVENHRQDADRLADRLFLEALLVEVCHEVRHGLGVDVGDRPVAESRQDASQGYSVGLEGARGDVDPGGLPPFRDVGERGRGRPLIHQAEIGDP